MHLAHAIPQVAREHHDLGHDHFGHAARVREGRVEHRDAVALGAREIHLVRADAKAAEGQQPPSAGEDAIGHAGLAADAEDVHVLDTARELFLAERARE